MWGGYQDELDRLADLGLEYFDTAPSEVRNTDSWKSSYSWLLYHTGNTEEAARIHSGIVEDNPDNHSYRSHRAVLAASQGEVERVCELLHQEEKETQALRDIHRKMHTIITEHVAS